MQENFIDQYQSIVELTEAFLTDILTQEKKASE